jgi:hypothetical protein
MVSNQPQVHFSPSFSLADFSPLSENFKENLHNLAANLMDISPVAE